jgi:hypothetical protein
MSSLYNEALYIFPDSILYGSFLMGLTTLSSVHAIFFISILLGLVVLFGLQNGMALFYGSSISDFKCKSQLFKYTFEQLFIRPSASNPSYGVYLISFACAYLATSLYMLKDELDVLDSSKIKQYYISISTLFAVAFVYLMFRLVSECDSLGSSTTGFIFGGIIGVLMVNMNVILFGKESENFLGIPLLRNKTSDGSPIYICSK